MGNSCICLINSTSIGNGKSTREICPALPCRLKFLCDPCAELHIRSLPFRDGDAQRVSDQEEEFCGGGREGRPRVQPSGQCKE